MPNRVDCGDVDLEETFKVLGESGNVNKVKLSCCQNLI